MKTGHEAIEAKKVNSTVIINKYADPTEGELFDLSISDAEEIASEDPSLIWAE